MDIREYIQSGIIEQYVLGLTNASEAAELEQLRKEYPELNRAVANFEQRFEKHLMSDMLQPPAFIKSSLEKQLFGEAASKAVIAPISSQPQIPRVYNTGLWKYLAAASVILLVISTALNFYFYSNYKNTREEYQALLTERNTLQANNASYQQSLQLFRDTSMVRVPMKGMPGKEQNLATVLWDKNLKDVYIYINNMQQTPSGKQYQLWAIVDGKPVDAGLITYCADVCRMPVKIDRAQSFAITLENKGGSPTPTMEQLFVFGNVVI